MSFPVSSPRILSLAMILVLAGCFVACDEVIESRPDPDVFVADFYFEGADAVAVQGSCETLEGVDYCWNYSLGDEDARAYSGADDDSQLQEGIREALNGAGDGMAVIAYQAIPEFDNDGNWAGATYYSMPYVQAVEGSAVIDGEEVPFVDFVTTLSYGFDDADFYLDIETSDLISAEEVATNPVTEYIDIRLVTIPGDVIYQGSALRADLAELYPRYEDLAAAYNLPERPMPRRER